MTLAAFLCLYYHELNSQTFTVTSCKPCVGRKIFMIMVFQSRLCVNENNTCENLHMFRDG